MRVLEKSLIVLAAIGVYMKYTASGGDFTLFISMLILSTIYFIVGFLLLNGVRFRDALKKDFLSGLTALNVIIAVITGLALSIICVGLLFKLLYLTGAENMLAVGSILLLILTVFAGFRLMKGDRRNIYFSVLSRSIPFAFIGIALWLIPRVELVKIQYKNHPAFIQAYINYEKDPANIELLDKLQEERLKTVDLKE